MAEIDPVILQLISDNSRYLDELRRAQREASRSLESQRRDVDRLEQKFRSSSSAIALSIGSITGALAGAFSVQTATALIDSFTRLQNSLSVAGLEGQQLAAVQERLLGLSGKYGVSIEELGRLFGNSAQAASDLGASQGQLLLLTEATAQALKITGTNATQAGGAMLGLTQALAAGTVRAEEFNQINEGGLRPLLQLVANTEKYGGSIARLRTAVVDGKVSSQEFFAAIQAGAPVLGEQASQATLTLAGAFEALRSQLVVYVGEAAKSSGVTAALADGLALLAQNLDAVFNALATIAVLGLARFAAGAAAAATSAVGLRIAAIGLAASLNGTAAAATLAGRALLGAMTGPIGIAVVALTVGIASLADETDRLDAETQAAQQTLDQLAQQSKSSQGAMFAFGDATGFAADTMRKASTAAQKLIEDLYGVQGAALVAARALALKKVKEAEDQNREVQESFGGSRAVGLRFNTSNGFFLGPSKDALDAQERVRAAKAELNLANQALSAAAKEERESKAARTTAAAAGKAAKPKKGRAGRGASGPSAEEIERRFNDELANLAQQTLSAERSIATSAEDRAELSLRSIELARIRAEEGIKAEKDYNATQKKRLLEQLDALAFAEREAVEFEKQQQLMQEANELASARYDAERDAWGLDLDMAESQKERRDIQLALLDLEYEYQKSLQEAVIASQTTSDVEKERARIALASLNELRNARTSQVLDRTAGPLDAYRKSLTLDANELNEAAQSIAVDGLEKLNDGLTDAILNAGSLKDAFGNMAKAIVADLLRIAIQQAIIKPLAENLFGGGSSGGGGGIFGAFAGLFGRASGGPVEVGRMYRVNEANQEYFQPLVAGSVRTPAQARASSPAAATPVVRLYVQEGQMFEPRVQQISGNTAVEIVREAAPQIRDAAVNETFRRGQRPGLGR